MSGNKPSCDVRSLVDFLAKNVVVLNLSKRLISKTILMISIDLKIHQIFFCRTKFTFHSARKGIELKVILERNFSVAIRRAYPK